MQKRVVIQQAECRFCLNCKLQIVRKKNYIKCIAGWWNYESSGHQRIRHRLRSIMEPTKYFINKHKDCPDFTDMRYD